MKRKKFDIWRKRLKKRCLAENRRFVNTSVSIWPDFFQLTRFFLIWPDFFSFDQIFLHSTSFFLIWPNCTRFFHIWPDLFSFYQIFLIWPDFFSFQQIFPHFTRYFSFYQIFPHFTRFFPHLARFVFFMWPDLSEWHCSVKSKHILCFRAAAHNMLWSFLSTKCVKGYPEFERMGHFMLRSKYQLPAWSKTLIRDFPTTVSFVFFYQRIGVLRYGSSGYNGEQGAGHL